MRPFDFIIMFGSFIYALALTHLLVSVSQMIRLRRSITLSWPHVFWMTAALLTLVANWISLWDFHKEEVLTIGTIALGFFISVAQYLFCSLVTPDLKDEQWYDLRRFHASEGRTYIGAASAMIVGSLLVNALAASGGIANWGAENGVTLAMLPFVVLPLFVRTAWFQTIAPLIFSIETILFLILYYPALR